MTMWRTAWRQLWARPGHSVTAIAILALGLASALFLFGAVNGMVLRPLPFPHAERLVAIGWTKPAQDAQVRELTTWDWAVLRDALDDYDLLGIEGGVVTVTLGQGEDTRRYSGAMLDAAMPALLGVAPILGRGFTVQDDRAGAPMTVLLGERVWRSEFHADPAVVGRPVRANGEPATIIGVLPDSFGYPFGQEIWIPRRFATGDEHPVNVVARLRADVGLAQARLSLAALGERLGPRLSGAQHDYELGLQPLAHRFVGQTTRQMIWMMFAAGLLVLILACMNVANLHLGQVIQRRRELAVRSALGADRRRLLRELLAESTLMSLIATMAALTLSHYGGRAFIDYLVTSEVALPYYFDFAYDWRDALVIPVIALATCVLAGLAPALRAAGSDAQQALRDGGKGSSGGMFARVSKALVVVEVALTVVLLVGAAMFIRGIGGMAGFDLGTSSDPRQVLTGRIGLFASQYPESADQARYFERLVERIQADPQVIAASAATGLPGRRGNDDDAVIAEGAPRPAQGYARADHAYVDPGFARVYGLRLREGRFFDARDHAGSERVAVIGARLARQLWPDRPALGQRLHLDPESDRDLRMTVIGVIDDVRLRAADDRAWPTLLMPMSQMPSRFATIAVLVRGDAAAFAPALARSVRTIDADTPVGWLRTQAEVVRQGRVRPLLLTQIFTAIGVLALILATVGLYGVLAASVAQRTREIGIRRAIGAPVTGISRDVFGRIGWQLAAGLAIGVGLGLPWSAALADPRLNTRAYDPLIFGVVVAIVVAVAFISALAPLRRALRVDPVVALRHE